MNYKISHPTKILKGTINLTASKSESNRVLIIQTLCKDLFEIKNLAPAEDTKVLKALLAKYKAAKYLPSGQVYDVGAAGTTMRFLTALLACNEGIRSIITGSERMKIRPIALLVEALKDFGAVVEYEEATGFPPLSIYGKKLFGGEITLDGSVSSQYISALLLIAPTFEKGLTIKFQGKVTSSSYVKMTLKVMESFGINSKWVGNTISITKQEYCRKEPYTIEGDWSSASYWFAMVALSKEADLIIKPLQFAFFSLQGDAAIVDIFSKLGVATELVSDGYRLTKGGEIVKSFEYDFTDCPDIAQTVAVVVGVLGIPSVFTGLHTLLIKETNRTAALKSELAKINIHVEIVSSDMIRITPFDVVPTDDSIKTYEDHRMAMAFAPLALIQKSIVIEDPEVVRKSYPDFWDDLISVGFVIGDYI